MFTILHTFDDSAAGRIPYSGIIQATSGLFYGENYEGVGNFGTVFSLNAGLRPFVATSPWFGPVGSSVIIMGNNLASSTSVTFNGVDAAFVVISNSQINTTVPAGATTGQVKVSSARGALTSVRVFHVTP